MKYLLALAAVVFLALPGTAEAKPVFTASQGDVTLTLFTDECQFRGTVDMPLKATWTQKGETLEGCLLLRPDLEMVLFYFPSDKSVFAVPMSAFQKVLDV